MTVWPAVEGYNNGESVSQDTLNRPISQLAQRTEYLKQRLADNDRTKVAIDATVFDAGYGMPKVGMPVFRVGSNGAYAMAAALTRENEWFYADPQAMAVGVVGDIADTSATIVLYGLIDFGGGIDAAGIIADKNPTSGRYYLSYQHGKLTAQPGGPIIYVCDCQIAETEAGYKITSMLVNPQYRDTGESHVHRAFVVSGKPVGGYAISTGGRYKATGILATGVTPTAATIPAGAFILPYGAWMSDDDITYTFSIVGSGKGWDTYTLQWTSTGDGVGTASLAELAGADVLETSPITVGTKGLRIRFTRTGKSVTPDQISDKTWVLNMPDDAQAWLNYKDASGKQGFRLNMGMYPAMARYTPPLPVNGAALNVGGVDLRGEIYGDRAEWRVAPADADGGPWLVWYGGEVDADSETAPFTYNSGALATPRDITYYVNRMRVGPSGFVTSLEPAPGSPLKVTSAQTGADAVQGALQITMDIDFTTENGNTPGAQVVKAIEGNKFKTGMVVERIVAGPGITVSPGSGQGTVTVTASNALYAGDFETIALKNAKQDLAGGIFPYTKLLGWTTGSTNNIETGFVAKFRVPDHIPYNKYNVVVSASVFGESANSSSATRVATFAFTNYTLADRACAVGVPGVSVGGSIAKPAEGATSGIGVSFPNGYTAFNPVLIQGFENYGGDDTQFFSELKLKNDKGSAIEVYPGYFVGISISRIGTDGMEYVDPIGFLSLRWNLVAAE